MSKTFSLAIPHEKIASFCRRWHITELALFGSVLRPDFREDSDVDVLVTFRPGAEPSFLDWPRVTAELTEIFGRKVDLVPRAVEESDNYIRRDDILKSAEVIYR